MLDVEDLSQLSAQITLARLELRSTRPTLRRRLFSFRQPQQAALPVAVQISAIRDTDHPEAKVFVTKVVDNGFDPDAADVFHFEVILHNGSSAGRYIGTLLRQSAHPDHFMYRRR